MSDRPKKPFHDAVHDIPPQKEPEKPVHIRDKDNAEPRPTPPVQAKYPAPNRAPPGMSGNHLSRYDPPQVKEQSKQQEQVPSIVKTHSYPELLTGGRFLDRPGYGFAVEVNPYRSFLGIQGGRLSTLEIQHEGKIVAQYQDMRWTVKPDKQEHIDLVQRLQDRFGEPRHDFIPIAPIEPDKDRGHDR